MAVGDIGGEVLSAERLADELRLPVPTRDEIEAIAAHAPVELRAIAHYALLWGVSDDGYRDELIQSASLAMRFNLWSVVAPFEDQLQEWLAGWEAHGPAFSEAYIAYTCMTMASDSVGPF